MIIRKEKDLLPYARAIVRQYVQTYIDKPMRIEFGVGSDSGLPDLYTGNGTWIELKRVKKDAFCDSDLVYSLLEPSQRKTFRILNAAGDYVFIAVGRIGTNEISVFAFMSEEDPPIQFQHKFLLSDKQEVEVNF